jgi:DedD protein
MDTPSKERLVGAIIFVAVIVLLVPEILSGPHRSAVASGTPPAGTTRSYIIELGNPVKPAGSPATDAKPAAPAPLAQGTQQLPPVGAVAAPASATRASVPPAVAPQPQPVEVAKSATPTPAKSAAPSVASGEAWGAQLGSFSKAENAERLATKLRGEGYRAFVSPIGSGSHTLHRVRVGPEPTREAAEALIARLKRDGETASVVTLP